MAGDRVNVGIEKLLRTARLRDAEGQTDGQLLEQFLTRREAAEHLGWPEETVAGRLARGRELLVKRLLRHGLGGSASTVAAGLFGESASASVPISLASSTIKAAVQVAAGQAATAGAISGSVAALAEGVLQRMFLNKLKSAAAVLLTTALLVASGAAGILAYQDKGEKPQAEQQPAASKREKERAVTPPRKSQAPPVVEEKGPALVEVIKPGTEEADKEDRIRPGDLLKSH